MRPSRSLLVYAAIPAFAASLLAVPAAAAAPGLARSGGSVQTPSWTPPLALDQGGAEPSIRVPLDGKSAAYVSAPAALGSNFWRITEATDAAGNTSFTGTSAVQPDLGTGGGDAEISVGNALDPTTGCAPIAYSGLHNIDLFDNFTTAYSTDCGKTFSLANPYSTQNTLTDRQWQTFDGRLTNHLIYHKVDSGQIVDSVSYDGGRTYVTLGTPAGATGIIDANHAYTLQRVKIGNIVTDYSRPVAGKSYPVSGEQVHTLWAVFDGVRDAQDFAQSKLPTSPVWDHLDTVYVARSDDGGLTWTDTAAYSEPAGQHRELDLIFPVLAVDAHGNLFAGWTDGNLIQYVTSTDGGATWSKPYTVNPGEVGAATTNGTADVFPWIAAAGDGRLDVVWYHGQGGDTTGYRSVGTPGKNGTNWTVAFAQLFDATHLDATGTPAPTVMSRDLAITPPMHNGNVCNNGTTCGVTNPNEDRTLLDFFQVAIDSQGRANIAYADDYSSPKTSTVKYTRQNSGADLLTGAPVVPDSFLLGGGGGTTCTADAAFTDPEGDATGFVIITSSPRPNDDPEDITKAWVTTDEVARQITFHVKVKDLEDNPPSGSATGSDGEYFDINFAFGGTTYDYTAQRSLTNGEGYELDVLGTAGRSTVEPNLTGSFNGSTDEITANLPFTPPTGSVASAPHFKDGDQLTGLSVTSRRDEVALVPNVDDASGACPYVVGAVDVPPTTPEAPVAVLLPIAAVTAVAVVIEVRRRRRVTAG